MARDTLATLIRLAGGEVDEARRELEAVLAEEDTLITAMTVLEASVLHEQSEAGSDPTMLAALSAFLVRAREERKSLEQQRQDLQPRIDAAREALAEAFANQKKYEIAKETRDLSKNREEARRESLFLDEVGINAHNRKG